MDSREWMTRPYDEVRAWEKKKDCTGWHEIKMGMPQESGHGSQQGTYPRQNPLNPQPTSERFKLTENL